MADASAAPATKKDIHMIMGEIGKLYDANERWKDEILGEMEAEKMEVVREFHFVAENFRKDAIDAHKEKIENHEDRIKRLERHAKIPHRLSA